MDFSLLAYSIAILLLPFRACSVNHTHFHVGVILDVNSSSSPVGRIGLSCLAQAESDFYSVHNDYKTRLILHVRDSNGSVVDAAAAALDLLQFDKVDAVIGPQTSTQANFVMDLGDRDHVPIISFSATSPSLIPRTPYFVRTAESDANQVQAIASIVKAYRWNQVVIVYEDTELGFGIMPALSNALQDVNARVSYRSAFPQSATDDFIMKELYKMKTMQTRVFVVHMSSSLGTRFFLKAKDLGMMIEGYAWIVTSGLTDLFSMMDDDVVEAMQGVLGIRPLIPNSEQMQQFSAKWVRNFQQANEYHMKLSDHISIFGLWAYDTMWALAMAVERVQVSEPNPYEYVYCPHAFDLGISEKGPKLLAAFLETKFRGLVEDFELVNGQLKQKSYQIVNVVGGVMRQVAIWTPSCGLSGGDNPKETSCHLHKNLKTIIWPGGSTSGPRGFEVPVDGKKLRIGVPQKPGFNEFLKEETDPQTNATQVSGYFKDIFESVIHSLKYAITFDYVVYPFYTRNGSRVGSYDDLVNQVSLQEQYDERFVAMRQGIRAVLLCLVLVTWALVASLLNSTYTASLSSRLTVQRLQPAVTDVTQLIKSGDYVGTQDGSFLVNFLVSLGFDESKIKTFKSAEDSDEALTKGSRNGGISAYYDVMPHIRLFISQYCGKYKMVGPIYRTAGFAFAFPKGSPVIADISRAITEQTEKARIQEIEQILSSNSNCLGPEGDSTETRITLRSFLVLFGITGGVTLACLVISLLLYLENQKPLRERFTELRNEVSLKIQSLKAFIENNFDRCCC